MKRRQSHGVRTKKVENCRVIGVLLLREINIYNEKGFETFLFKKFIKNFNKIAQLKIDLLSFQTQKLLTFAKVLLRKKFFLENF